MKMINKIVVWFHNFQADMIYLFADIAESSIPQEHKLIPLRMEEQITPRQKRN
ncbi:MAG: hypothetical protein KUG82_20805 [Pseudomonadales bacterium]|nr:hypothetical protein [Pseudomonadales bacterium]